MQKNNHNPKQQSQTDKTELTGKQKLDMELERSNNELDMLLKQATDIEEIWGDTAYKLERKDVYMIGKSLHETNENLDQRIYDSPISLLFS